MDSSDLVMLRFGELGTKGKNLKDFINRLGQNVRVYLKPFKKLKIDVRRDHIYIYLNSTPFDDIKPIIKKIPGILSFSHCIAYQDKNIDSIAEKAVEVCSHTTKKTFKVVTKRIDKLFHMHSSEVNRYIADKVLSSCPNIKVDVHSPELELHLSIREDCIYFYYDSYPGIGGYPNGIAGKALMLLSGGIDSPVASFLMMKRGVKLEMIHFAAPPYTSEQVLIKIKDIMRKLLAFQAEIKLYIVPFTDIQKKIYEIAGTSYAITIMRRMMLRLAERTARSHNCLVLSNGESIGQVASQTLKSIRAIEAGCNLPIIRPLATYDKLDIIALAKKIDTYDISIRPYEDCCTIFAVKDPTTAPHFDKVEEIEKKFDFSKLLDEAYQNIRVEKISLQDEADEEF